MCWASAVARVARSEPMRSADEATFRFHAAAWACCMAMPLASAAAHALHCAGPRTSRLVWRLDFLGIVLLLGARAALEGYLLLWCHRDALAQCRFPRGATFGTRAALSFF